MNEAGNIDVDAVAAALDARQRRVLIRCTLATSASYWARVIFIWFSASSLGLTKLSLKTLDVAAVKNSSG
jgi:hypothetical protein